VVETDATRSSLGADASVRRPGLLVAGLSVVVLTVAVLQTAVVPVLGVIAHQLNSSTVAVSWAVTANLLAAAASTPLIGRLADLHSKKRVLLTVLVVVLFGSVLAATTSSLALLIIARVLQAASYGLYPIGIAILREELPEDRMGSAMSVLSGTLGFGGGMGLVVVGLLMSGNAGYHRVFWLTTGFTLLVIVIAVLLVPARPPAWPSGCRHSCWRFHRVTPGAGPPRRRWAARGAAWLFSPRGGSGSDAWSSRWCPPR
jgi:MFS family permease